MAIQYTNRIGQIYYLYSGKTKTGNDRYFFSMKKNANGETVKEIPNGYEIYEHPEKAQVFLRKKQTQLTTDIERQLIKKHVANINSSKSYLMDCKEKHITIYESNVDPEDLTETFHHAFKRRLNHNGLMTSVANIANSQYTAILRYTLADTKKRTFIVERFCFRGAIDDWIFLDGPDILGNIAGKYVGIIGTDQFFDLIPYNLS